MGETEKDLVFNLLFTIGIGVLLLVVFIGFTRWLLEFRRKLQHLNGEIQRTQGKEQKSWIKKRRKLWLSILPFVRYSDLL